jgi:large subunit ribosomal protein L18e
MPSSKLVQKISKRLKMSRSNRHPVKLSLVARGIAGKEKVAAVVAKVLDDERMIEIPKITLIALQISKAAKSKIEKCGGKVYTFDEMFKVCPSLDDVVLIKGDVTKRKSYKYFGAPGDKFSEAYPKCTSKGKNRERRLKK